ncbi:hypothetical protein EYF80_016260 [Liparis tanakae]|uniref:Uncharacterized protein n=1 Tax=Liparis tanakae TaxID=230148 RepID=A0A4Z2I6N3_9TELE|nr:hypothetical protein EYF80_016260 [Liparis tanakae]
MEVDQLTLHPETKHLRLETDRSRQNQDWTKTCLRLNSGAQLHLPVRISQDPWRSPAELGRGDLKSLLIPEQQPCGLNLAAGICSCCTLLGTG